ncbi:hypothetical protein MMC17_009126 [Xylographa soralifera]|nr:hypothetical protein [Xylographa soralifera]
MVDAEIVELVGTETEALWMTEFELKSEAGLETDGGEDPEDEIVPINTVLAELWEARLGLDGILDVETEYVVGETAPEFEAEDTPTPIETNDILELELPNSGKDWELDRGDDDAELDCNDGTEDATLLLLEEDTGCMLERVELAGPEEIRPVDPREVGNTKVVELCKVVVELPNDGEGSVINEDRPETGRDGPADERLLLLETTDVVLVVVEFGTEVLDRENVRDGEEPPPVLEAEANMLEDVVKLETGVVGFEPRSVFEYIRIALVPPQYSDGEFPQGYVAALVVAALFATVLPQ